MKRKLINIASVFLFMLLASCMVLSATPAAAARPYHASPVSGNGDQPEFTPGLPANMSEARQSAAEGVINGILYIAGGHNGTQQTPTLQAYNPATNSWSLLNAMPDGRYSGSGAGVINYKLYVTGGWDNTYSWLPHNNLYIYDPATNTWSSGANMPNLNAGGASGVIADKLYVTTPCDGFDGFRNFLHVYDPATNSWTSLAPSPAAHNEPAYGVINNKLYVAGGNNESGILSRTDCYDPGTNSWTTLASLPEARTNSGSAVFDNKLYVIGGSNGTSAKSTIYIYDPLSNTWTSGGPLNTPRNSPSAGVINNIIYVAGGSNEAGLLSTVEAISPAFSVTPVSVNAPESVSPNTDFTAILDIGTVTDLNAVQYDILFNPAVLRLDGITDGQIGAAPFPVPTGDVAPQQISPGHWRVVQTLGLATVTGSGYLSVLHYHVIGSLGDSSSINLTSGILSGLNGEIEAAWSGDTVAVSFVPGDANGDGTVNVLDMTKVARIILLMDPETPGADANRDGMVNVLDITKIARSILNMDPKYGGQITLAMTSSTPDFDLLGWFATAPQHLAHESIWDGDWTKGPAGGYGTGEVLWEETTNIPDLNTGSVAESWYWTVNAENQTVDTVITLRDNIYFAQSGTAAGNLVGGRKLTTDDVVWCLDQHINNPESDNYKGFPLLRGIHPIKTGPNQITITHPLNLHLDSIMRLFSYTLMFPPELWDAYGYSSCTDIMKSVGTGPYYVKEYIAGNMILMERNPNYWKTDPTGPGKGNRLPYTDKLKYAIIPDLATRQAALRTAVLDQMGMQTYGDMTAMTTQIPVLKSAKRGGGHNQPVFFRIDQAPFNDVRVRRAMMLAVDLNEINNGLYNGEATLINFPYYYTPAYAGLYLGTDDPGMPASVKELFTYNPVKAEQLLTEAGYPDGFLTKLTIVPSWADYYSILKEYWEQIDVFVEFVTVPDYGQLITVNSARSWEGMLAQFISPVSTYPEQAQYTGDSWLNPSRINDPYVNAMAALARNTAITSMNDAMAITKELTKYLLDQVYAIPAPHYPLYNVWWPWLKNYTGETNVGYMTYDSWVQYVWVDQNLKDIIGY